MDYIEFIGGFIYAYCTDFVINCANILNLSYYEINAIIFCLIWPLLTLVLIVLNMYKYLALKKKRRISNSTYQNE